MKILTKSHFIRPRIGIVCVQKFYENERDKICFQKNGNGLLEPSVSERNVLFS